MINIDKYAYASKLKNINPMEKIFFAILTLSVCLWANNLVVSLFIITIMAFLIIRIGGTNWKEFLRLMIIPTGFLVISIITIVINYSSNRGDLIYSIKLFHGWIGISKNGVYEGINMFFKVLGALSSLYFISLTTPMIDVISVLKKFRIPDFLIEIIGLVYRFIFILLETSQTMFISQNSRLGYRDTRTSFKSLGALAATLFIRSFKRANDLYISLESRGYNGELNVLQEQFKKRNYLYGVAIAINLILIIITIFIN
ncbi:cobalt ECF transporter T component CbiQ [Clostridium sp. B9]|uniref:cobalt ECF transporter T component CbiQ n=1 Tax=Clostridium sp. B9 TaxID=3423224 RepID=UPI003D2EE25C